MGLAQARGVYRPLCHAARTFCIDQNCYLEYQPTSLSAPPVGPFLWVLQLCTHNNKCEIFRMYMYSIDQIYNFIITYFGYSGTGRLRPYCLWSFGITLGFLWATLWCWRWRLKFWVVLIVSARSLNASLGCSGRPISYWDRWRGFTLWTLLVQSTGTTTFCSMPYSEFIMPVQIKPDQHTVGFLLGGGVGLHSSPPPPNPDYSYAQCTCTHTYIY